MLLEYLYKNFNINYLKQEYTTIRLIFNKKDNYKFKIIFNNALRKNPYNILIIINKECVWLSGLIQKIYMIEAFINKYAQHFNADGDIN